MHPRYCFLLLVAWLPAALLAQAQPAAPALQAPVMNDAFQGGWQVSALQSSVDQWTQRTTAAPDDAMARLNLFRSERNAALVRGQGQIDSGSKERLQAIVQELDAKAPDSFEAHLAHYHQEFPGPAAFAHLERAYRAGPERAELIGPLLVDAVRRGDQKAVDQHAKVLKTRGQVAPGLWSLADDLLRSVDQHAILIAAGEMDAYPLWARQGADGQRRDVLVVDYRLLEDAGYRSRVWARSEAAGVAPADHTAFIRGLSVSSTRPVFLSLALGARRLAPFEDNLYVTGIAAQLSMVAVENIPRLEEHWKALTKTTEAGPLARNYLVPGSILLDHYRSIGDEGNASRMEQELRGLSKRLGAIDLMITNGIFEH